MFADSLGCVSSSLGRCLESCFVIGEMTVKEGSMACLLTASGPGAVAVIEAKFLTPAVEQEALHSFVPTPARDLQLVSPGRILFGSWRGEDIVIVRRKERHWEIHCHGGSIAVERILTDLQAAGVIVRASGDGIFGMNDDPVSAAIMSTLIRCRTPKTAGLALAQLDGRLARLIHDSHSHCEATRCQARRIIAEWGPIGHHLAMAWRVAFVGAPNVGKSSLINAMAGLQRSIVSSMPGTTRDLVEVDVVLDGWMFQLVDTAGVRAAGASVIEDLGIEQSLEAVADCDLLCVVMDATQPSVEPRLWQCLAGVSVPVCVVLNKADLMDKETLVQNNSDFPAPAGMAADDLKQFFVSAMTSAGLPQLFHWIVRSVVPIEPDSQTVLPIPDLPWA